ncbi:unnamed protein product [Vitrella brassicaformis CCMP3155]|uniref:PIH1 N-terminal domain-containing protein n=2 Tax=Vitrella brassicaformis TaxID=1169539 RepID=A0A0G4GEX6_VITBC|nr:unnamed protein product [Vitrella brassicaformis CCMP3155]|eukprot:CEM27729.1 unnamed protein product [Vitrella brassicaformis CCMP3155]
MAKNKKHESLSGGDGGSPFLLPSTDMPQDQQEHLTALMSALANGHDQKPPPSQAATDEDGCITVTPKPLFVLKTKDIKSGMKLFINICQSEHLPPSHTQEFIDEQGQPQTGVHMSASIGPVREDFDKKGAPCMALDIVFSDREFGGEEGFGAIEIEKMKNVLQRVAAKSNNEIQPDMDDGTWQMPRLRYKGSTVEPHRIRKKAASRPLVQDASQPSAAPLPRCLQVKASMQPQEPIKETEKPHTSPSDDSRDTTGGVVVSSYNESLGLVELFLYETDYAVSFYDATKLPSPPIPSFSFETTTQEEEEELEGCKALLDELATDTVSAAEAIDAFRYPLFPPVSSAQQPQKGTAIVNWGKMFGQQQKSDAPDTTDSGPSAEEREATRLADELRDMHYWVAFHVKLLKYKVPKASADASKRRPRQIDFREELDIHLSDRRLSVGVKSRGAEDAETDHTTLLSLRFPFPVESCLSRIGWSAGEGLLTVRCPIDSVANQGDDAGSENGTKLVVPDAVAEREGEGEGEGEGELSGGDEIETDGELMDMVF